MDAIQKAEDALAEALAEYEREVDAAKTSRYRAIHYEKVRASRAKYRGENRERIAEYERAYSTIRLGRNRNRYAADAEYRERLLARSRAWHASTDDGWRARKRAAGIAYYHANKEEIRTKAEIARRAKGTKPMPKWSPDEDAIVRRHPTKEAHARLAPARTLSAVRARRHVLRMNTHTPEQGETK